MANTMTICNSNKFEITNREEAEKFFERVSSENEIHYHIYEDEDTGKLMCGFGSYGDIYGIYPSCEDDNCSEYDELDFDLFIEELQKILTETSRVELIFISYEKLRYVDSIGVVITKHNSSAYSMSHVLNQVKL